MLRKTILIVDDEVNIVSFMKDVLEDEGYRILTAEDGRNALSLVSQEKVDCVILDIMMPGINGFEVCRVLRAKTDVPILILSAKQSEVDKVLGLGLGADDYVVKPFNVQELIARVAAHLRRYNVERKASDPNKMQYGPLIIDLNGMEVSSGGEVIPFTYKEFEIVRFLALHPGQVFSREQIYEKIWGLDALGDTTTVTEHIKKIRQKIAPYIKGQEIIKTVWGVGYKWEKI